MNNDQIAIVGGGHMGRALLAGLLGAGHAAATLRVADPVAAQRERLAREFAGVAVTADNGDAASGAATWVFAVKPSELGAAARGLAALAARERPLVLSIAAGVRIASLAGWLGASLPIVRCMPNRPAEIRAGVTGLCAGPGVGAGQRARAERILSAVGACLWLEVEEQLDAVTAVSGSGPAYLFLLVEALEQAAAAEGLDPGIARRLAVETAHGAARLASESGADPAALRASVTSPGGTTAAALAVLEAAGFREALHRAVHAARRRAAELAG